LEASYELGTVPINLPGLKHFFGLIVYLFFWLVVLDVGLGAKGDAQRQEDELNPKISSIRSRKSVSKNRAKKVKSSSSAEKEEEEKEELPEIPFSRILALNKPEWCYMAGGERVLNACQV